MDFIGAYDSLTRLKSMQLMPGFEWDVCAFAAGIADDKGLRITPSVVGEPLSKYDLIVVPGGFGTRTLQHDKAFIDWLRTSEPVKLKASVCTGSLLLGAAGFLKDKRATTHPSAFEELKPYCAQVVDERVVDEGGMLGRYYVQYYNYSCRRTGTLWEGRYRATLIDTEQYLLTCMRYIELNPVRANNMAGHPSEYPWSSYRCNALGEQNALLTPHPEYQRLGKTDEERQAAYRQLFRARIADKTLDEIREATNKAWVLGDDRFKRKLVQQLDRPIAPTARGGDHKSDAHRKRTTINRV